MAGSSATQTAGAVKRPPEPGHQILARLGKKVLRPGGKAMTERLVVAAAPTARDRVVEFGPGRGATARLLLRAKPRSYAGVDPDPAVALAMAGLLGERARLVPAEADDTGLPDECADLVVGEAMLTMHSPRGKAAIVAEAARLLAPGGRYAIHELAVPEDSEDPLVGDLSRTLARTSHVPARPLRASQWERLLTDAGLQIAWRGEAVMALLEPGRMVADEGVLGFLRIGWNLIWRPADRKRVLHMHRTFRANASQLRAVAFVAVKPPVPAA